MIETNRLTLRTLNENDIDYVYDIYTDSHVCKYLLVEPWLEKNKAEKFNAEMSKKELESTDGLNLGVVLEDEIIGVLSAWYTEMKDTVEIGYVFSPSKSGKGYATEAVRGLINYLFKEKGVHRIVANCDARNTGSAKLCERAGMRKEAHFIQDFWNKGEWTDSFIFAVLQPEIE